ncbi:hypothetical protein [Halalkalicoccus tibetensis]|uniref:Uncharacterized protein n=1 Tax=Halalkalicoccus tibetensis TaxID=175632 RepID=A0ABD5V3Q3_9EURY
MKTRLLSIVGVLVFVSAVIHLSLGISGLVEAVSGDGSVLLPALYLLGGLAAIALLGTIVLTPVATTAYAAGTGLMALFLLAYADVHAFGVAESTLGVDLHDHGGDGHSHDDGHDHNGDGHSHDHDENGHGHSHDDDHDHDGDGHSHDHGHDDHDHDDGTLTVLADHLLEDAYALVSKSVEAGAAVGFAVLASLGDRE